MVVREADEHEDFYVKIGDRWLLIDEKFLRWHPGGNALIAYKNKDATTAFHTFHVGSKEAYRTLQERYKKQPNVEPKFDHKDPTWSEMYDVNMGKWEMSEEKAKQVADDFDKLRIRVRTIGLLNGSHTFFARKFMESLLLIGIALLLQYHTYYIASALVMGLAWQQLGWMIHEYCHHQHFKNHNFNDFMSLIVGNLLQGFSSGGWKNQHNIHHAATNVVGRDGDLDLMPFFATVISDLKLLDASSWVLQMLPYQHLYWTFSMPLLRLSWLLQSIQFVSTMNTNFYDIHRQRARIEQLTLSIHWLLVFTQLSYLPDLQTVMIYFFTSQLFGGFLLAHVVTFNHYSTDKFPYNASIIENYPCLQVYTTRNMRSDQFHFIDWLWGGLNYQIEHHLFPTMPRNNLCKVVPLVREFCEKHDLPYMVDDYWTGWKYEIEQLRNVARTASKMVDKVREPYHRTF
ncbi:hypothetical protein M3Y94_00445600 [Aphelenchoides besseyi]|nr:hypothetical protein M3Y94_00445600 [Aphelenchoides besseyi]